jgi:hypothetical protein
MYHITHCSEGKIVDFSSHQVVIKDLKYPKNVLVTRSIDDITRLYKYDNFGSLYLPSILFLIVMT